MYIIQQFSFIRISEELNKSAAEKHDIFFSVAQMFITIIIARDLGIQ